MDKKIKYKSFTKYIPLDVNSGVSIYCDYLTRLINNDHKYIVLNTNIEINSLGAPYCVINFLENEEEKDNTNKNRGYNISGDLLSIDELNFYDEIVEKAYNQEAKILYTQDLFIKNFIEKTNEYYKLIIYAARKDGQPFRENDVKVNLSDKRKS